MAVVLRRFVDYYAFNVTLGDPVFWFGVIIILLAGLFPILAVQAYVFNYVSGPERELVRMEISK